MGGGGLFQALESIYFAVLLGKYPVPRSKFCTFIGLSNFNFQVKVENNEDYTENKTTQNTFQVVLKIKT